MKKMTKLEKWNLEQSKKAEALGYLRFVAKNVNPKGKVTNDCVCRAISLACEIPYEKVLMDMVGVQLETGYAVCGSDNEELTLAKYGFKKMKQPRKTNGKKYVVGEIAKLCTKEQLEEGVVIRVAKHMTCVKKGQLYDIWNCSFKAIVNYYVRVR